MTAKKWMSILTKNKNKQKMPQCMKKETEKI